MDKIVPIILFIFIFVILIFFGIPALIHAIYGIFMALFTTFAGWLTIIFFIAVAIYISSNN